jgi:hypothetical protein
MKYSKIIFTLAAVVVLAGSCAKKFEERLASPNAPAPDKADVDLYLNQVQLSFANMFNTLSDRGMEVMRMQTMGGPTYLTAYDPETFNGVWNTAYRGVVTNINALEALAVPQTKWHHLGIAQILKAYTAMALVDNFGDVPWSEASNSANSISNPKVDKGADVYAAAIKLLDDAIVNLGKTASSAPLVDLYYGTTAAASQKARWITLAKTLKLKAFLNTRLIDAGAGAKINALITAGDLIDTEAEDFVFRYGTNLQNPDSRDPRYAACYRAAGGVGRYIGNYLAWTMFSEKVSIVDPRIRYYFRRQTSAPSGSGGISVTALACQGQASPAHFGTSPFCMVGPGYFGRDHADASGIPPDGAVRTAWGVYPAGGDFDALSNTTTQASTVTQTSNVGGRGAGIQPIWLSSFTAFAQAEAALMASATGTPRTLLETAVRASITKVLGFPATVGVTPTAALVPTTTMINNYVTEVLSRYDLAVNNDGRLDVIMKEYYIAAFGNGLEPYNSYRRTGKPANLQPTLTPSPGPFIKSFWYPSDHVALNTNAAQKPNNTVKVFWDNGSATNF